MQLSSRCSMSTGSKIGIGFGAVLGGMLLGLFLLWAYVSSSIKTPIEMGG